MTDPRSTSESDATTSESAARLAAFCSPGTPEVFHGILYHSQIWTVDPFDVDTIHTEAREAFERLLHRAAGTPPPQHGKILLLHGEAGSGKTHLMRAFRSTTHALGTGYFGYLQMTTEFTNYGRYLLSKLIDSLDQPYYPPHIEKSALMRLSTWIFEAIPGLTESDRTEIVEGDFAQLSSRVHAAADQALADPRLAQCELDIIRAMIYLQRDDARIKKRVLAWLRCEDLSPHDRAMLGDMVPQTQEEHPLRMVCQLGHLMAVTQGCPLVICVDQLEDMFQQDIAVEKFRRVVDTLVSLIDLLPTAVVVIACLEDYYKANQAHLTRAKLDRLERDPEPVRLRGQRTLDEISSMVHRRLEYLYDAAGLTANPVNPTDPFRQEHLAKLVNFSTRNVLEFCRLHRQQCIAAARWIEPEGSLAPLPDPPPSDADMEPLWNDFRAKFTGSIPDNELAVARLIAWGIDRCGEELGSSGRFSGRIDGRFIYIEGHAGAAGHGKFLIAVCDKGTQRNGLSTEVSEAEALAGAMPVVIVRSTSFPKSRTAAVSKQLGNLVSKGGRRVSVENTDYRTLAALHEFHERYSKQPEYRAWLTSMQPISQLPSMRSILALDRLPPPALPANSLPAIETPAVTAPALPGSTTIAAPTPQPEPPPVEPVFSETEHLSLGTGKSIARESVYVIAKELKQHMVFLGGTGSGKTTAAMSLIEQLLLLGVPAILVDRKGDLSRYADPDVWTAGNHPRAVEVHHLRDRIDIALYTPGSSEGRPLAIPIMPPGLTLTADTEAAAASAANSIAGMLGYKTRGADQALQAILAKAIEVLASISDRPVTVSALQTLVDDQDQSLLNAVGGFESKHYRRLAEDLLTLNLRYKSLLALDAEQLDIDALLGRNAHAIHGKTKLCIINTQFLGSDAAVDFWLAQFLFALERWRSKSPCDHLQAILMMDEADKYLPAVRTPSTKAPLEGLLRRSRSAGLGIMLATQSPGDFDYRCKENIRGWLVGRIKEPTALAKLKPMFSEARVDATSKLPWQETGEFYLLREREVVALKAQRSLIETRQVPELQILQFARQTSR